MRLKGYEIPDAIWQELLLTFGPNVDINDVIVWLLKREVKRMDIQVTNKLQFNNGETIKIEDFIQAHKLRQKINSVPLSELKLEFEGKIVPTDAHCIKQWELTGLNNWDYMCCYLPSFIEDVEVKPTEPVKYESKLNPRPQSFSQMLEELECLLVCGAIADPHEIIGNALKSIEDFRSSTITEDTVDAKRWRALLKSERLRLLGTAGFGNEDDYRHFGMEFWTVYPDRPTLENSNQRGIEVLTNYVDAIIKRKT